MEFIYLAISRSSRRSYARIHSPYNALKYCLYPAPREKSQEFFHILQLCAISLNWFIFPRKKTIVFVEHWLARDIQVHTSYI
jgi:hypothetical protein